MSAGGGPGIVPRACRSCGVELYDLLYVKSGRTAPIEVRLSSNGNILANLEEGTYFILGGKALASARLDGAPLRVNHFVSCPQAVAWHRT